MLLVRILGTLVIAKKCLCQWLRQAVDAYIDSQVPVSTTCKHRITTTILLCNLRKIDKYLNHKPSNPALSSSKWWMTSHCFRCPISLCIFQWKGRHRQWAHQGKAFFAQLKPRIAVWGFHLGMFFTVSHLWYLFIFFIVTTIFPFEASSLPVPGVENEQILYMTSKVTDGQYICEWFVEGMNNTLWNHLSLEIQDELWWPLQWDPVYWLDKVFNKFMDSFNFNEN